MTSINWRTLATDFLEKRTQPNVESSFNRNKQKKVRINENLRLVPFDRIRVESLKWYQDPKSMRNIVGTYSKYSVQQIQRMYHWQDEHGLLYYIEYKNGKQFQIVGDVWLADDDYAIVIDQAFRNRHIGRMVTKYFIYRSQKMGRDHIIVSEIFNWNKASQQMFKKLGFTPFAKQKDSWSYRKQISIRKTIKNTR